MNLPNLSFFSSPGFLSIWRLLWASSVLTFQSFEKTSFVVERKSSRLDATFDLALPIPCFLSFWPLTGLFS